MPKTSSTTIITIGVYGFTENAFFKALQDAGVDTFCDIRARRGVRGSEYPFANSVRLQKRLGELGIRYLHFPELAPTPAMRQSQYKADEASGIAKRKRTQLTEGFIEVYRAECLAKFDPPEFVKSLGPEAQVVALFCVERVPEACHRSLLAKKLHQDLGLEVRHLVPE